MSIQITACLNPFSQERTEFTFDSGITINEIIKKIDALHAVNTGWRVMIDDEIVTDFERIPEESQRVYLKLVPEGDNQSLGNGMKAGGVVLSIIGIIVGAATSWTGVGAFFGMSLLGAGIGLLSGGVVLYNTQIPSLDDNEKPEQDPAIRGSRNQMRPYGKIPVLLGKRRIYADACANPYTWVDSNGAMWLHQLFCVAQKDIQIDTATLKIDETLLKDYSATGDISRVLDQSNPDPLIQMKISYGDSTPPLYDKCVHEIQLNTVLKHQTEDEQDGSIIRTTPAKTTKINVDVFFYNGLGKYNKKGDVESTSVELRAEYKKSTEPDSAYQLLGYFSKRSNTISGSELKTKRYAITKDNLVADSYTVKISRVTEDSTDTKIIDTVYVGSIRAANNDSPVRSARCQQVTLIGLKIKASEKLNNIVEKLNFVAQSEMPVYNSQTQQWTNALTSNPASAAMYAMQGDVAQQQLSHSDIDLDSFAALYDWCEDHDYECNAYITDDMTINSLLSSIASTCRAEILRMNGKITVIQDIAKNSFVQLFTPRNSHDYKETMALADIPDVLKMGIVDKTNGYAENEVPVYNTPSGNPVSGVEPHTSQNVPLWGVTDSVQARKLGMFNYAVCKHRFTIVRFSCDFEYLMCRKGDWIKYAGDIALAGLKQGRIKAVDGQKLILDEQVTMENGKSYAIRIRKSDGTAALCNVQTVVGTSNEITISGQIPSGIEGCLFAFGVTGNETIDLIVTDIQCGENLSADLTCVEYAPEIFGVDEPDFVLPDFVNKLSSFDSVVDPGDVNGWRTFATYNDSDSQPAPPTGGGTSGAWHLQQTENSKWISTKTAASIYEGEWSAPMPTGKKVMDVLVPDGEIGNPDPVEELVAIAKKDSISVSWSALRDNGLNNSIKSYILSISKDNGETWSTLAYITDSSYEYIFKRTGTGAEGYPEASYFANWRFRIKAENVFGYFSTYVTTSVNVQSYLTWQPKTPTNVKATAYRDYIEITWDCNLSGIYGGNLFTVKKNGVAVSNNMGGNRFLYYFNRSADEYPEKSDFDLASWGFSVTVSNESGNVATANATYDKTHYLTWKFPAPTVKVTPFRDYVEVSWNVSGNYYGDITYQVEINNAQVCDGTKANSYIYYFDRDSQADGYPESSDLDDWDIELTATSEIYRRNVTTYTYDDSYYGTWLIATPVITPKAYEKRIEIPLPADKNSYGDKVFDIFVDNTLVASNIKTETYDYVISPMLTSAVSALSIKVREKSEAGYADSLTVHPDVTEYKGYTPSVPTLNITSSGRSFSLKWNDQDIYNYGGVLIQVAKAYKVVQGEYTPIVDPEELVWYAPALGLNPYASEDNYKQGEEGEKLNVATGTAISFSVPLYGQTTSESVNTLYAYRIKATTGNEISPRQESAWSSIVYIEAKATSAQDVVKAWKLNGQGERVKLDGALGVQQIFVEELSALCANLGYITDGAMQGDQYNYWAVNDTILPDETLIRKGSFRVGGEHQYIKVTPEIIDGVPTGEYDIDFVIDDFTVSATGDISLNGSAFTVYDDDNNIIFQTSNEGNSIMVEEGTYKSDRASTITSEGAYSYGGQVGYFSIDGSSDTYRVSMTGNDDDPYILQVYKNDTLVDYKRVYNDPFFKEITFVGTATKVHIGFYKNDQDQMECLVFNITTQKIEVLQGLPADYTLTTIQNDNYVLAIHNYEESDVRHQLFAVVNLANPTTPADSQLDFDDEHLGAYYNAIGCYDGYFYLFNSASTMNPNNFGSLVIRISTSGVATWSWMYAAFWGVSNFNISTETIDNAQSNRTLIIGDDGKLYIYGMCTFNDVIDPQTVTSTTRVICAVITLSTVTWNALPLFDTPSSSPINLDIYLTPYNEYVSIDGGSSGTPHIPLGDVIQPHHSVTNDCVPWWLATITSVVGESSKGVTKTVFSTGFENTTPDVHNNYTIKGNVVFSEREIPVTNADLIFLYVIISNQYGGAYTNIESNKLYFDYFTTQSHEFLQANVEASETVTGRGTYATGIGFSKILYDEEFGLYKYILESGATLEFDEHGNLVTKSSQGAKGERGVSVQSITTEESQLDGGTNTITFTMSDMKTYSAHVKNGTKGSTGVTPQFSALAGEHINEVGTPKVTLGGTAEEPTLTFDYLKGQAGAGSETAEKLETARNLKVNLASSNAQSFDGSADAQNIGVRGTLPASNGGTGETSLVDSIIALVNALTTESTTPVDDDYLVAQEAGGGANTTTYHRKPFSALWEYIKDKISSVLKLTATTYDGKAASAENADSATSAGKLTTARKTYVTLGTASTSTTRDWSGDTTIPVHGTLKVANGGTGMSTASYKNAVVVGNSSTVTDALRTIRTANGAFYATAQDGAPSFGTLPVGQGGTGATSLANITVGNSSKLGNIAVQTNSIGGATTETGNHWSYVVKAKFTSTSGYIVYSNGLKIQWGVENTNNSNTQGKFSFYLNFTQKPFVFCQRGIVSNFEADDGSGRESNVWNISTTGFYYDSNLGYSVKNRFYYLAIGY